MISSFQLGGSDQWGNITAGIELMGRVMNSASCFGVTVPLLTTSNGVKFGKSAGNAIWLSPTKTSPYQLFQYLLQSDDRDVIPLLHVSHHRVSITIQRPFITVYMQCLSPLALPEIEEISKQHSVEPERRVAHESLAMSVTSLVHGQSVADLALKSSKVMFGGSIDGLASTDLLELCKRFTIPIP